MSSRREPLPEIDIIKDRSIGRCLFDEPPRKPIPGVDIARRPQRPAEFAKREDALRSIPNH